MYVLCVPYTSYQCLAKWLWYLMCVLYVVCVYEKQSPMGFSLSPKREFRECASPVTPAPYTEAWKQIY